MSLVSVPFFVFVLCVVAAYYVVPQKIQWWVLLAASVGFYAAAGLEGLLVMLATTAVAFGLALAMGRLWQARGQALAAEGLDKPQKRAIKAGYKKRGKLLLLASVLLVLGVLLVLKYTGFFLGCLSSLAGLFGVVYTPPEWHIFMPLGISFYTLMVLGYLVDVYREKVPPERNIARLVLCVSYFPQITQGPIGRYETLQKELFVPRAFSYQAVSFGAQRVVWGLFKKMVIADHLGVPVGELFGNWESYGGLPLAVSAILYSIQIYADFSGCMDIVLGVSEMLGISLMENFRRPYFSRTLPEFWRRWHISLGGWFREYVFYPVSVSKVTQALSRASRGKLGGEAGRIVTGLVPLYCVWMLTGLWHGAEGKYVMWGLYHGTLIVLSLIFTPYFEKLEKRIGLNPDWWWFRIFQTVRTFALCCFGRLIFRATSVADAFGMMSRIGGALLNGTLFDLNSLTAISLTGQETLALAVCVPLLFVVSLMQEKWSEPYGIRTRLAKQVLPLRWLVYYAGIIAVLLLGKMDIETGVFLYGAF